MGRCIQCPNVRLGSLGIPGINGIPRLSRLLAAAAAARVVAADLLCLGGGGLGRIITLFCCCFCCFIFLGVQSEAVSYPLTHNDHS